MRRLLALLVIGFALSAVAAAVAAASSISLIAPWGQTVYANNPDTITLTYSIGASRKVSSNAIDAATAAAADWATWLSANDGSGQFTVQSASGGPVNVKITIKNGGGVIAGQTHLSFDRQGFIKGATVQISGSSFGLANDYDGVYNIAKHELGHAFVGLGHSDDSTDLMYPTLNGYTSIGSCELSGFNALYGWLTDGSPATGPTLPLSSSVTC
jgi:Matrixin